MLRFSPQQGTLADRDNAILGLTVEADVAFKKLITEDCVGEPVCLDGPFRRADTILSGTVALTQLIAVNTLVTCQNVTGLPELAEYRICLSSSR